MSSNLVFHPFMAIPDHNSLRDRLAALLFLCAMLADIAYDIRYTLNLTFRSVGSHWDRIVRNVKFQPVNCGKCRTAGSSSAFTAFHKLHSQYFRQHMAEYRWIHDIQGLVFQREELQATKRVSWRVHSNEVSNCRIVQNNNACAFGRERDSVSVPDRRKDHLDRTILSQWLVNDTVQHSGQSCILTESGPLLSGGYDSIWFCGPFQMYRWVDGFLYGL